MFIRKLIAPALLAIAALAPAAASAHFAVYFDPETGANFTHTNASTSTAAAREAKAGCVKLAVKFKGQSKGARCKALREGDRVGIIAIAWSESGMGFGQHETKEGADRAALAGCNESAGSGNSCEITAHWEEHVGAGRASASVSRTTSRNVVRCSNQCYNGSCTRTFEDGRKEKWQAPRKFDPFTSNWGWDTSTNACGI